VVTRTAEEPESTSVEHRLGAIRLAPGVRPRHVAAYVCLALTAVSFTGFLPLMLPYLLGVHLHAYAGRYGQVIGTLSGLQNLAIAALSVLFGALADRVGRRQLLLYAYVAMAGGVALYPLQSSLFGFAAVAVMIGSGLGAQLVANQTLGIDYPRNESRGLFMSSMLAVQLVGTAVIVGQIGVRIPGWTDRLGAPSGHGVDVAFWCMAALGLPALLLTRFGLKPESMRPALAASGRERGVATDLKELWDHARRNGGFQMALLGSMTVRGDLAVVATFLSLTIAAAAKLRGIDPAAAARHAGAVYSLVQVGALVGALTMGLLLDRFERRKLLLAGLAIVSLALLLPMMVPDVLSGWIDPAALVLGLAEGAITVPTSVLLGQEAPAHLRGIATSVFVALGVLSVAFASFVGGVLFDRFGTGGPFIMAAALNAAILARCALIVRAQTARR
jgi:MFS family permease